MARNTVAAALWAAVLLSLCADAVGAQVSTTLTVAVSPQGLTIVVNPSSVSNLPCNTAPGTKISQASASGGNGNPVTYSLTGGMTDCVINATSGAISVGSTGLAPANCNKTHTFTVTGTQP